MIILYACIIVLSLFASQSFARQLLNTVYQAELIKVQDGDTVHLSTNTWIDEVKFVRLRLARIDTPEISWRVNPCEKILGLKAKAFMVRLLRSKTLTISNLKYGKYAGRYVGTLYADGEDVSQRMLDAGHAVVYNGRKKKTKVWCTNL